MIHGLVTVSIMATSWDNARRHARALETALDAKLSTYSKIASTITRGGGGGSSSTSREAELEDGVGGYKLVEEEIEELLSKVGWCLKGKGVR